MSDETKDQIVKILYEEGGGPVGSIHTVPCTWTEGQPKCDCLDVIAQRIVDEVILAEPKADKTNA